MLFSVSDLIIDQAVLDEFRRKWENGQFSKKSIFEVCCSEVNLSVDRKHVFKLRYYSEEFTFTELVMHDGDIVSLFKMRVKERFEGELN